MDIWNYMLPLSGLLAGILLGYVARRNFFCTLSALESHWYGNNSTGLRTWVLAAICAAFFTQILIYFDMVDISQSFYLTPNFSWLGAIIGGLSFGFGMAFVGTCGFGALVRLGGGSLKSFIALLILGITALSAQRGLLGFSRAGFTDNFQLGLFGAENQSIPEIVNKFSGLDISLFTTLILLAIPLHWVLKDARFRTEIKGYVTAVTIGMICAFGWYVTSHASQVSFENVQIESMSFVTPVGDTLFQFATFTGVGPDYGVGLIFGVVIGATIAARSADNVTWEACDDARELGRHLLGAAMMGFGGVLALGCTIGQGISAASLLTISAPITMLSIGLGAKMGLAWLLEGSIKPAFSFR
jgi:hypothetical protein